MTTPALKLSGNTPLPPSSSGPTLPSGQKKVDQTAKNADKVGQDVVKALQTAKEASLSKKETEAAVTKQELVASLERQKTQIAGKDFNLCLTKTKQFEPGELPNDHKVNYLFNKLYDHDWLEKGDWWWVPKGLYYLITSPLGLPAGAPKALHAGYENVATGIKNWNNRRTQEALGHVGLDAAKEEKPAAEKLNQCWEKYGTEENFKKKLGESSYIYKIEDVVSMRLIAPLKNDGTLNFKKDIQYIVVVKEKNSDGKLIDEAGKVINEKGQLLDDDGNPIKGEDGRYQYSKPKFKVITLFEGELDPDDSDDCIVGGLQAIDWSALKKFHAFDGPNPDGTVDRIEEESYKSQQANKSNSVTDGKNIRTPNNCWMHAGIQGFLRDKNLLKVLKEACFDGKDNEDTLIHMFSHNPAIPATGKTEEEILTNRKLKVEKILKNRPKNLLECIFACEGKSLTEQKDIIDSKAAEIRKDLGFNNMDSQEDVFDLISKMNTFLSDLNLTSDVKLNEEEKLSRPGWIWGKYDKNIKTSQNAIQAQLKLSSTNMEDLINNFFDENLTDGSQKKLDGYNWKIDSISHRFDKKPEQVSFHIDRSGVDSEGKPTKKNDEVTNIPMELGYDSGKFKKQSPGTHKLKYAIIHQGNLNSGHYYTIYRENDEWVKYDNTDVSDKKLDQAALIKELGQAVYLHYEDNSLHAPLSQPVPSAPPAEPGMLSNAWSSVKDTAGSAFAKAIGLTIPS